jgi:hypothetical protein
MKIQNTKRQRPFSNPRIGRFALDVEDWSFSGAWMLVLGALSYVYV